MSKSTTCLKPNCPHPPDTEGFCRVHRPNVRKGRAANALLKQQGKLTPNAKTKAKANERPTLASRMRAAKARAKAEQPGPKTARAARARARAQASARQQDERARINDRLPPAGLDRTFRSSLRVDDDANQTSGKPNVWRLDKSPGSR